MKPSKSAQAAAEKFLRESSKILAGLSSRLKSVNYLLAAHASLTFHGTLHKTGYLRETFSRIQLTSRTYGTARASFDILGRPTALEERSANFGAKRGSTREPSIRFGGRSNLRA